MNLYWFFFFYVNILTNEHKFRLYRTEQLIRSTLFFCLKINDKLEKLGRIDFKFIFYITDVERTLDGAWEKYYLSYFQLYKKKLMRDCIQQNEEETRKQSAKNHKQKSELIKDTNIMFSFYLFLFLDLREAISLELQVR